MMKSLRTHINSQFVADFGLDHLWSVFNTGELQSTHILTVLFLHCKGKYIHTVCVTVT